MGILSGYPKNSKLRIAVLLNYTPHVSFVELTFLKVESYCFFGDSGFPLSDWVNPNDAPAIVQIAISDEKRIELAIYSVSFSCLPVDAQFTYAIKTPAKIPAATPASQALLILFNKLVCPSFTFWAV